MRVNVQLKGAVAFCGSLALAGCVDGSGFPAVHETVVETRALDPGGVFTLENVNGRVTVTTWSEPRVKIEAEKAASSEARLRELRVEIDGEGHRVDVRTRMPGGTWIFGGGGSRVQYRITLPEGAQVRVGTVNGGVEVTGVAGELRASTTNGSVEVTDAAGVVEASTVNGGIRARYRVVDPESRHSFSTTNGSINVSVGQGAGGRVEASTVNGSIENDVPLESTSRATRRRLEGRLGKGSGSLHLNTINGSIHLRKG
jgi:DUF4097 and DUF4098 domain-containing protein YvlB